MFTQSPKARKIKNHPVVNHDPRAARLQEMKKEIEALRTELWQTRQTVSESKPTSTVTVDASVATEVSQLQYDQ